MYRPLAVAVVAAAVGATALWALLRAGGGAPDAARAPFVGARVDDREGVTVVRLAGPPRQKGRALGEALAPRIRKELERVLPEEPLLRDFVVRTCGERLAQFLPAEYREEIAGIAEGCGVTFLEALFLNTRFELAKFGLAGGGRDLQGEGAVGPGPEAGRLFGGDVERDLVVVIHEDTDPPLVLVGRPGMAGGFLGVAGDAAAVVRPIRGETEPTLKGLVWTLLLRRLLEDPPQGRQDPAFAVTGPVSVAMALPDGAVGTLNLAVWGATWYAAGGPHSLTTDEGVVGEEGELRAGRRAPAAAARISETARRLLADPPAAGSTRVTVGNGQGGPVFTLAIGDVRRVIPLSGPR